MISSVSPTETSSRIVRYLPGRLVVAWSVLGAAAAVGLMWVPAVYEAQSSDSPPYSSQTRIYLSRIGVFFSEGRVRVLGKVVYEEKYGERGETAQAINWWHCRVAAFHAGVGGLLGALVGWREQRRYRRQQSPAQRIGWLWIPLGVAIFVLLFVFGIPGDIEWSLLDLLRSQIRFAEEYSLSWSWKNLLDLPPGDVVRLVTVSVAIGWAVHVAAGARGVRLSFGRRLEQAADYGEDWLRARAVDPTPSWSKPNVRAGREPGVRRSGDPGQ